MTRFLLVASLMLFASSAFAKSPASTEDPVDGSAKPGKTGSALTENQTTPAVPVAAPARTATPLPTRGGKPRWHSLLPGMIR